MTIPLRAMFGKIAEILGMKRGDELLEALDLSILKTDVHSHFIPGIDDGAQTMEDSLTLIKGMEAFGYKKVVTTPHVMSDYYRNTPEIILKGRDDVQEALEKDGIQVEIEAAAEYYLDVDLMPKVKSKELLTFGDNYVLFELPFMSEPPGLADLVFEMQLAGYKPVLAHPERYAFWHMSFEKYQEWFDKGVILQLNINSITGHYSPEVKKVSKQLIDAGLIQLLGSDCHHDRHLGLMEHAIQHAPLHQLVKSGALLNDRL